LQGDSADVFIGRGNCRAFPLMFLLFLRIAGRNYYEVWGKTSAVARQKSLTTAKSRVCSNYGKKTSTVFIKNFQFSNRHRLSFGESQ
jgi:hypothetical protein